MCHDGGDGGGGAGLPWMIEHCLTLQEGTPFNRYSPETPPPPPPPPPPHLTATLLGPPPPLCVSFIFFMSRLWIVGRLRVTAGNNHLDLWGGAGEGGGVRRSDQEAVMVLVLDGALQTALSRCLSLHPLSLSLSRCPSIFLDLFLTHSLSLSLSFSPIPSVSLSFFLTHPPSLSPSLPRTGEW